jgi:hypothetical protein
MAVARRDRDGGAELCCYSKRPSVAGMGRVAPSFPATTSVEAERRKLRRRRRTAVLAGRAGAEMPNRRGAKGR